MRYWSAHLAGYGEISLDDRDMSRGYITCPECGGSGMDNDSLDHRCYQCGGVKRLYIKKDKNGNLTFE